MSVIVQVATQSGAETTLTMTNYNATKLALVIQGDAAVTVLSLTISTLIDVILYIKDI